MIFSHRLVSFVRDSKFLNFKYEIILVNNTLEFLLDCKYKSFFFCKMKIEIIPCNLVLKPIILLIVQLNRS